MKKFVPFFALLTTVASFLLTDCKTVMVKKEGNYGAVRRTPAPKTEPAVAAYSTGTSDVQRSYIDQFKNAAIAEMQRTGIPASITLAQGLLESGAGQSLLAQEANNHFGIKCGGGWQGPTFKKKDDDRDGDGNTIESCFRKYKDPNESFYDHSEFLRDPRKANRYGFLFNLDRRDYQGWARGLQSSGYATSNTYAAQLISVIERCQLHAYDDATAVATPVNQSGNQTINGGGSNKPPTTTPGPTPNPAGGIDLPPMQRIRYVNDSKVVYAQAGETLQDIAKMYSIPVGQVQEYNDNGYTMGQKLPANALVFIQRKHDRWRGSASSYFIKADQTMFEVSQLYGIRLDGLLNRNNLRRGQEPVAGEKILLRGQRSTGDQPRIRDVVTTPVQGGVIANPGTTTPVPAPSTTNNSGTPASGGMVPDEGDVLFEIGGDDPAPVNTPPTTPTVVTTPPKPVIPPPATTGTPYPGQTTSPPATTWPGTKPTTSTTTTPAGSVTYYTVERGDNLFRVAQKFNTTVSQLKQLNRLSSDAIQAGQQLRVK